MRIPHIVAPISFPCAESTVRTLSKVREDLRVAVLNSDSLRLTYYETDTHMNDKGLPERETKHEQKIHKYSKWLKKNTTIPKHMKVRAFARVTDRVGH